MNLAQTIILFSILLSSCGSSYHFNKKKFTDLHSLKLKGAESSTIKKFDKIYNVEETADNLQVKSDSIKLKNGYVIVADVFSVSKDGRKTKGKVKYSYPDSVGYRNVLNEEVETIIYDHKIQRKRFEFEIEPNLHTEKRARQMRKKSIAYLLLSILCIPLAVAFWMVLIILFGFIWGIAWFFSLFFGANLQWPEKGYFRPLLYCCLAGGALLSLIFLPLFFLFRKKTGIIKKTKIKQAR